METESGTQELRAPVVVERAKGRDYEFVPEATLLVLAAGLRIREVPIVFTDRVRGSSKLIGRIAVKHIIFCFSQAIQYRLRLGRFARRPAGKVRAG